MERLKMCKCKENVNKMNDKNKKRNKRRKTKINITLILMGCKSGSNETPSICLGIEIPAMSRMVGARSIETTGDSIAMLAGTPGPLIIIGTRISASYGKRLSTAIPNCPK